MSILSRNKPVSINIPKLGFTRHGYIEWDDLAGTFIAAVFIIIATMVAIALMYRTVRWLTRPPQKPPTVITKTIYRDALSAAQQAYIAQCQQNTKSVAESGNMNHGIPDVYSSPWTCTFAK